MSEITHEFIRGMSRAYWGLRTTINWQAKNGRVSKQDFSWLWHRTCSGARTYYAWDRGLGAMVYYAG